MNTLSRRLRKLEERLAPPIETEFSRRLRARLEAGLRRVAELRGESFQVRRRENLTHARPGLETIVEILQSGRQRIAARRDVGGERRSPKANAPAPFL